MIPKSVVVLMFNVEEHHCSFFNIIFVTVTVASCIWHFPILVDFETLEGGLK
jgi:hypothetical protein